MAKRVALVILDGWGHGVKNESDGVYMANTPCFDRLIAEGPSSALKTFGEDVGLPEGQMGNSEVGHLNIGAGRIVYQDLLRINNAIADNSFFENDVLNAAMDAAKAEGKKLHFMGLVSHGGVHSSLEHLKALCEMSSRKGLSGVYIHAFMDGRDCDPKSGKGFVEELEASLEGQDAIVASVVGRYFAMDRDKRWERVSKAYNLLCHGVGDSFESAAEAIEANYQKGVTDEFIEPCVISKAGRIDANDVVICFNFRTDRCREITQVLTQQDYPDFGMSALQLHYVTMTKYDESFKNVAVVFDKDNVKLSIGEVLAINGKKQIRAAETEKYPHVTFFLSGGREEPFNGEERILVNSPKVATYDLQPEMSAPELTKRVCAAMKASDADFICLNFANPDMVGHTGVPVAIISACEMVDQCLSEVIEAGAANDYSVVVIADHGNAEKMINADGSPNTAHTTNLVPCVVVDDRVNDLRDGVLADIAPTILDLMEIDQPAEMTGKSLVKR